VEKAGLFDDYELQLIAQAHHLHGTIYPCANKPSFRECFTEDNGLRLFWFNTEDHSTHVLTAQT
jgi:hypothetical protein